MKKKLYITFLIILVAVVIMTITVCAATVYFTAEKIKYSVFVNDKPMDFELPIVGIEGRTYVPMREFCEFMEFDVHWNEQTQKAEISTNTSPHQTKKPNMKDFAFLQEGTDIRVIYDKFGMGDESVGFGCTDDRYILENGSKLYVKTDCTDWHIRWVHWAVEEDGEWIEWQIEWNDEHFGKAIFECQEAASTQNDVRRKFKDFVFVEKEMNMKEVIAVLGEADETDGENQLQNIYHLYGGNKIILTYDTQQKVQKLEIYLAEGVRFEAKTR